MQYINKKEYLDKIKDKQEALRFALDIRKFEIDLYWKRATYFGTLIGATLAGFVALKASKHSKNTDILIILSCLGFLFSYAWFLVNKGSKFWQMNWEKHVDMLEDIKIGPLYKIAFYNDAKVDAYQKFRNFIIGPAEISVSKINQIISFAITILWFILILNSLPSFSLEKGINWLYVSIISITFIAVIFFHIWGRSSNEDSSQEARLRDSKITDKPNFKKLANPPCD